MILLIMLYTMRIFNLLYNDMVFSCNGKSVFEKLTYRIYILYYNERVNPNVSKFTRI